MKGHGRLQIIDLSYMLKLNVFCPIINNSCSFNGIPSQPYTGTVQGGDLVLSVSLNNPVHTLLPSIPPSQSQDIIIMFDPACDPTHPTTLVFGSSKQQTLPRDSGQSLRSTSYVEKPKDRITKQSDAIKHIHINQTAQRLNGLHEISPIEVQPDTPAMVRTRHVTFVCIGAPVINLNLKQLSIRLNNTMYFT